MWKHVPFICIVYEYVGSRTKGSMTVELWRTHNISFRERALYVERTRECGGAYLCMLYG